MGETELEQVIGRAKCYVNLLVEIVEHFGYSSLSFWSTKGDRRGGKGAIIFTSIFSSSGGEKVAEEKDQTGRRLLGKYWKLGQYGRDWVVHKSDEVV